VGQPPASWRLDVPDRKSLDGFNRYFARYQAVLDAERVAVANLD
jgi:hypothetical protein